MISILVLTYNEEVDLGNCLQSVSWSDDINVFDSFSTDRTIAIATASGATVHQRKFDNYASQRNSALKTICFKYPWVLLLDADEVLPQETANSLIDFVQTPQNRFVAARLRRRDFFMGTWLKHSQLSPYFIRLIKPQYACYEREINEVLRISGEIKELSTYFDHFPFSKGVSNWIERHNRYSTMEAHRAINERSGSIQFKWSTALFSSDFNERRFHLKGQYYRLPFRPAIKWIYMIFARRAFLDGRAGVCYATLQAIYEYFIVIKQREIDRETDRTTGRAKTEAQMKGLFDNTKKGFP